MRTFTQALVPPHHTRQHRLPPRSYPPYYLADTYLQTYNRMHAHLHTCQHPQMQSLHLTELGILLCRLASSQRTHLPLPPETLTRMNTDAQDHGTTSHPPLTGTQTSTEAPYAHPSEWRQATVGKHVAIYIVVGQEKKRILSLHPLHDIVYLALNR